MRNFCTSPSDENLTLFQKFKKAYKEQGKVLMGVHVVTSTVWFMTFYAVVAYGIDIAPLLKFIGISDSIIDKVATSKAGHLATMYLLYKLFTPLRYTVTLGGTNLLIRQLRKTGRMDPVPAGSKFKDLYKDGKVIIKEKKDILKDKTDSLKDNLKDRNIKTSDYKSETIEKRFDYDQTKPIPNSALENKNNRKIIESDRK